jgi:tetratricopeptide (TPR) repeat protein
MTNRRQHDLDTNEEAENTQRKKKRFLYMDRKDNKEPHETNRQINWESVTLIWFDSEVNKHNEAFADDMRKTEVMLRRLNDFVLLCSSEADCITQMERSKSERVILIISGMCATAALLEKAHSFRQVDTILIFCMQSSKYEALLQDIKNTKIKGIFTDQDSLERCIFKTVRAIKKQLAVFALYDSRKLKSIHNLDRGRGTFIWRQLMKEAVTKMPRNNASEERVSKQEILQKCREYYRDNKNEMKNIDEFDRKYTHDQAMWWYTKDTFLFRLVNKALLTEDIEAFYTYRFYIADLCRCIAENSKCLRGKSDCTLYKVYRGKKQSQEEIQRLKDSIGQLIAANGFLSATRSRLVADIFAGVGEEQTINPDFESVIYEISVDLKEQHVTLADLKPYSQFEDEEEVLFDLASVFKIESLKFDNDTKVWICRMSPSNKGADIAKEYVEIKRIPINNDNVIIVLGDLLFDMGEFNKSKIYFEKLNDRMPQNVNVLFGLGRAYFDLHTDYDKALEHFNAALHICTSPESLDLGMAAHINDYIGRVHRHQCRYAQALDTFAKSSDLYKEAGMLNHIHYAQMLGGIGFVQYQLGMDNLALQDFQQALKIVEQHMPFENPDLSNAYMNVSLPLYHMGQYDKALESANLALAIATAVFPGKSLQIGLILKYIGKYLYKKGDYDQALERHLTSQELYRYFYPEEKSPYFAVRYNNIGKVYYRTKKYVEANVVGINITFWKILCLKKTFS